MQEIGEIVIFVSKIILIGAWIGIGWYHITKMLVGLDKVFKLNNKTIWVFGCSTIILTVLGVILSFSNLELGDVIVWFAIGIMGTYSSTMLTWALIFYILEIKLTQIPTRRR